MRQTPIPEDLRSHLWHVLTIDPQRQLGIERAVDADAGVVTVCPVRWRRAFLRTRQTNPDARTRAKEIPPVARPELVGYLIIGVPMDRVVPLDLIQGVDGVRAIMCRAGIAAVVPPYMVKPMLEIPDQWAPPAPDDGKPKLTPIQIGERMAMISGLLKGQVGSVAELRDNEVRLEYGGDHPPVWVHRTGLRQAG